MPRPDAAAADRPGPAELLAALPLAVVVVAPDGRIAHANGAAEEMLRLSERAMAGQPIGAVLPAGSIGQQPEGHRVAIYDLEIETAGGHRARVDFAATSVPEHRGWRLLTLHHAAQGRSVGGNERGGGARAATGAAAMLAHEIKNPLSGIRGAAQLLGPGALTDLIVAEVDRVAALIDRMEEFGDDRPLPLASENIYPLLAHVTSLAAAGFARDVTIEEHYDPSLPPALVNRDALVQVLVNLLKNAREAIAGRPDGRITITTGYRHGVTRAGTPDRPRVPLPIEIAVTDNGAGPPADIVDHLFEPFVSGHPEGRGLGLSLVDKLVGAMDGIVRFSREGQPPSTVFRLLLPRAAA